MIRPGKDSNASRRYNIINDRVEECRRLIVHTFTVADAEDPDLWAAEPLHKWEQSEAGAWVMANAVETPEWHRQLDHSSYSYRYVITAKLQGAKLTEWMLRYGHTKSNF
jgi:hypothetical protein